MTEDNEIEMLKKLDALRIQHRSLDRSIFSVSEQNPYDQFTLFRLKREKLKLQDQICALEKIVYPDIIA